MYTFGQLKTDLRANLFPQGEAQNLVAPHNKAFVDALVDLQTFVDCLQQDNTDIFPQCATFYNCGLTVFDAPRGIVKAVSLLPKTSDGTEDDWCNLIPYPEVGYCHVKDYYSRFGRRTGCSSCTPWAYFGLPYCSSALPTPTDEGVPAGLPLLQLGYHYPQASTDRTVCTGPRYGVFAKDRGKIYVAPWIQSTESIVVKWDGIKRVWQDGDPVDDDPLLLKAVEAYVRYQHAEKYDREFSDAGAAKMEYETTRALLIHQCIEETRIRECETSNARSAPARVVSLYFNEAQTATASCPEGESGNPVTVTVPAGTVGSSISVADANSRALTQAQAEANARLVCTEPPPDDGGYYNDADVTAEVCCQAEVSTPPDSEPAPPPEGGCSSYTVPRGTIPGSTQAEANANARLEAQRQAALRLHCTYFNRRVTQTVCCDPPNDSICATRTVEARTHTATSQSAADQLAIIEAQNAARSALACTVVWNEQQSAPALQRQCGVANGWLYVTCVVPAHTLNAGTLAAANQAALAQGTLFAEMAAQILCSRGVIGYVTVTLGQHL